MPQQFNSQVLSEENGSICPSEDLSHNIHSALIRNLNLETIQLSLIRRMTFKKQRYSHLLGSKKFSSTLLGSFGWCNS